MSGNEMKSLAREVKAQILILAGFVTLMWVLEAIDQIFGGALDIYGILPRNPVGLRGILFAPFLHGNFAHLMANTIPFVILGWLVMWWRTVDFFVVSAIAMLVGGFGTWLIAPANTVHIGASGVIFGYLGYLLFRGYFERRTISILMSLAVGVFYGSLIWGVLPGQIGISWQGHLFGFVGGAIAARLLAQPRAVRI
ncbi:rhomboid family intramembrane serine protease [Oculatella sp. LEGE 06141]|uniref:rhomboid family intramembrane serine protease n=1 Tax=Oculatella sp. LEGE 06141 TaxID=1828648 RepID=UPI00187EE4F7|nr:rhomboid family intramembrane serine protease [Oculatella sp. LEGE 06141]MBE9182733.1 rhomboid family intramembrane serine protease [Oculatella sp. LEGE 06141]